MPGPVFDKYEVVERLAVGGMGEVLLARQVGGVEGFERLVILKTMLPQLAGDQALVDRFLDEARVVATLSHPNIVSVFEVGAWEGSYYLAMEYIPGLNLSQLQGAAAKAGQKIPLAVCARIGMEAALGLEHAHGAKDLRGEALRVVHRDVSPQNIMVREDGVTKVVDFGIARHANRASRTLTGGIRGKLGYTAPEQLRGRELDSRTDQFSLGVTLWELCTGRHLFERETEEEMVRAVLTSTIQRPSELVPDFPAPLEDVLMRMLEREPDRRFPRLYDVSQQLSACGPDDHEAVATFLTGVDARAARKSVAPTQNFVMELQSKPQRSRRAPVVALALALVAVAASAAFWQLSRDTAPVEAPPAVARAPAVETLPIEEKKVEPAPEPVVERPHARTGTPAPKPKVEPTAPAPAVPTGEGELVVRTQPWTLVLADGRRLGTTPLVGKLPAGPHTLVLVNEDQGINETRQIDVAVGETLKLDLNLAK